MCDAMRALQGFEIWGTLGPWVGARAAAVLSPDVRERFEWARGCGEGPSALAEAARARVVMDEVC